MCSSESPNSSTAAATAAPSASSQTPPLQPSIRTETRKDRKTVRFDSVQFREYPVVLGDHPSIQKGPPITLDWKYQQAYQLKLDLYEQCMPHRRSAMELKIPSDTRTSLLADAYTPQEMRAATTRALRVKSQRRMTITMYETMEPIEIFTESAFRKLKRFSSTTSKDDPADQWLEQAARKKTLVSSTQLSKNTLWNSKIAISRKEAYRMKHDPVMDDSSTTVETMSTQGSGKASTGAAKAGD